MGKYYRARVCVCVLAAWWWGLVLTLEFLSYKILKNFMRNEFLVSRKNAPCFAKLALLYNAKASLVFFVFLKTEHLAYEMRRICKSNEKHCSPQICRLF